MSILRGKVSRGIRRRSRGSTDRAQDRHRIMPTAPPATRDPKVEAQVFWIKHHKEITAFLVVAILAAIGFAGYRFYSERQNSAAARLLASAKKVPDYQQVITQYPNTPAGASAYLMLAQAQRTEKNFTASNVTLQNFLAKNPKHELATSARMAIAVNFESMGRADEALSMYRQIAEIDATREESLVEKVKNIFVTPPAPPKNFNAPRALISQVHLLKAKNQNDAARQICETIIAQYSDSAWAGEAFREMRALKPSEPAQLPQVPARSTSSLPPGVPTPPAMLARPAPAAAPTANPAKKPN